MSYDKHSPDRRFFGNFSIVMIGLVLAEVVFVFIVTLSMPQTDIKSPQFLLAEPMQSAGQTNAATAAPSAPVIHHGHGQVNR